MWLEGLLIKTGNELDKLIHYWSIQGQVQNKIVEKKLDLCRFR